MKMLMYKDWKNKRVKKIKNIFGEEWFFNKKILDIACNYGEVGIEFLRLGADVTFTDIDKECLDELNITLYNMKHKADTFLLDLEQPYDLKKRFDLALHLGSLYCIQNWKLNLETVLKHTNTMILETVVNIDGLSNDTITPFTETEVEQHLADLGCKTIKILDSKLNTNGRYGGDLKAKQIYDWDKRDFVGYDYNELVKNQTVIVPRRMWIVVK